VEKGNNAGEQIAHFDSFYGGQPTTDLASSAAGKLARLAHETFNSNTNLEEHKSITSHFATN